VGALQIEVRYRRVRGAEVDADGVAGHESDQSSTSAGAMTFGSNVADIAGSRTEVAIQPWCFSAPRNGGWPATLPVSRIRSALKPAGTATVAPSESLSTGSRVRYCA